ncbi:TRAP transporter substrate-binding protein [Halomonas sp. BN3-1]|uniref:TRAP transporter substrate-binding protein n=1 Tax=Halomonas sp. BN3-1 TaxID=2082393 RepID=UPI000D3A1A1B|nr:TRAP transporter substrate-binding protein [Halomonas sp. BN3-1]
MNKCTLTLSALALALASTAAQADKIVFAIGGPPGSLQGQTSQYFADALQERLGDAHEVEYYHSGQIGDERQLIQKLRTPQSEWRTRMFETWGANPTPMAFSEVFVALQTGVVDGQENPLSNINGAKFQEVQDYLSLSNHVYSPIWLTAGKGGWEKLPEDVRSAIQEVAVETQGWALAKGEQLDSELVSVLEEGGMAVNMVDRGAFVEASAPVYEAFANQVDGAQDLIDRAMALAEE